MEHSEEAMKEEVAPAEEEDGEPGPEGMGVPEFWLRAMKNHEVIEEQITLKVHLYIYPHLYHSPPCLLVPPSPPPCLARSLVAGWRKRKKRAES